MSDIDLWTGRVVECGQRIARLLASDVEHFVAKEVRGRFIDAPDFAKGLDDAQLAALKARTLSTGTRLSAEVGEALSEPSVWRTLDSRNVEDDVRVVPQVTEVLESFADRLDQFLGDTGLPIDEPVEYRLPVRFIDGADLKSLTRALWKAVAHLETARAKMREEEEAQGAARRARRWDEA